MRIKEIKEYKNTISIRLREGLLDPYDYSKKRNEYCTHFNNLSTFLSIESSLLEEKLGYDPIISRWDELRKVARQEMNEMRNAGYSLSQISRSFNLSQIFESIYRSHYSFIDQSTLSKAMIAREATILKIRYLKGGRKMMRFRTDYQILSKT